MGATNDGEICPMLLTTASERGAAIKICQYKSAVFLSYTCHRVNNFHEAATLVADILAMVLQKIHLFYKYPVHSVEPILPRLHDREILPNGDADSAASNSSNMHLKFVAMILILTRLSI